MWRVGHTSTFSSLSLSPLPSLFDLALCSRSISLGFHSTRIFHVEWLATSIVDLVVLLRIFFFSYHHYGPKDHYNSSCNKNYTYIDYASPSFHFFMFFLLSFCTIQSINLFIFFPFFFPV